MARRLAISPPSKGGRQATRVPVPACIGGWNTRDPEDQMLPTDALKLTNFFCQSANVEIRPGYVIYAPTLNASMENLWGYNGGNPGLFALANSSGTYRLWDVTNPLVPVVISFGAFTPITNSDFSHINYAAVGGNYLVAVNGVDVGKYYDGANWHDYDSPAGPPITITGLVTSHASYVANFKRFIFFVERNSMNFWYLPAGQVGGAATQFPLGIVANKGGHLVAIGSYTMDSGNGPDDYAIFYTSEGEVIVYSGNDPGSTTTWSWVGTFQTGRPLGKNCITQYGGDLLLLTEFGVIPVSSLYRLGNVDETQAFTDKINPTFNAAAISAFATRGWQAVVSPLHKLLLINVPMVDGVSFNPYVMNTQTKAWSDITNWSCRHFINWQGNLYFASPTGVMLAWSSYNDGTAPIVAEAWPAFNYFGKKGLTKKCTGVRPLFRSTGIFQFELGFATDFSTLFNYVMLNLPSLPGAIFDLSLFDSSVFGGSFDPSQIWQTPAALEFDCAAIRLRLTTNGNKVSWSPTDYLLELGGL